MNENRDKKKSPLCVIKSEAATKAINEHALMRLRRRTSFWVWHIAQIYKAISNLSNSHLNSITRYKDKKTRYQPYPQRQRKKNA